MSAPGTSAAAAEGRPLPWLAVLGGLVVFACLIALGTWQVERLHWKEALLATIDERIHGEPLPLAEVEQRFAASQDVDYLPVTVSGTFLNGAERHFFATWQGDSGFFVYTPLRLDDGRVAFVNRGFVPYDRKEPTKRPAGQLSGRQNLVGLARNPLAAKPSMMLPDNDPAKNIFYWKDLMAMRDSAGLPAGTAALPFFIDAGPAPTNPGGLPVGGVTMVDLPNNHLQYALTWYGLAAALAAVAGARVIQRRRPA